MVTLNSDTCDRISVFCTACAGIVPGATVGAAAFAIPALIKHLSGADTLEKLLKDTSKEIKDNVGEWTRQLGEYKADELASAEGAIENIIGKLQPDPKSLMNANRDHKKLADRVVIHASQIAVEFSRKKLPGKNQAKINRQILRIILVKTLDALERHPDYEAVLAPILQREFLKLQDRHDEKLNAIISRLNKAELNAAEEAGIPHSTIIKLANRINDDVDDPDQALKELEHAVEIAVNVQQKGKLGSNLDAFVSEVLKRVAELSRDGRNDEASEEVDRAFEQWQERQEQEKLAGLELLNSSFVQDMLRRDAAAAAKRLLQIAEMEYTEEQELFNHLRKIIHEWLDRGLNQEDPLELEISAELAKLILAKKLNLLQNGILQSDLANIYNRLGERDNTKKRQIFYKQAISSYESALKIMTQFATSTDLVTAQVNYADFLHKLGNQAKKEKKQDYFQRAHNEYQLALENLLELGMESDADLLREKIKSILDKIKDLKERQDAKTVFKKMQQARSELDQIDIPLFLPAAVEPVWKNGKIRLPANPIDSDLDGASIEGALIALKTEISDLIEDIAGESNIDDRALTYLIRIKNRIPSNPPSQATLFSIAHNEQLFIGYSKTVNEEWPELLAARFHALSLYYQRVMRQFPDWRKFKANADQQQFAPEQVDKIEQLTLIMEQCLREEFALDFVEQGIADVISEMSQQMVPSSEVTSDISDNAFAHINDDVIAADLLASIGNLFKIIAEGMLAKWNPVSSYSKEIAGLYIKGADKQLRINTEKIGEETVDLIFKWGKRIFKYIVAPSGVLAAGTAGATTLGEWVIGNFPTEFSWLEPFLKLVY